MANYEPQCVLEIGAELGEHPLWSASEQRLYWLDIENSRIHSFDPDSGLNETRILPTVPGCFAFRRDGSIVVAGQDGLKKGVAVNTVIPGATSPGMVDSAPEGAFEFFKNASPFDRVGRAGEIAAVVAFLASAEASWVSGAHILANGAANT